MVLLCEGKGRTDVWTAMMDDCLLFVIARFYDSIMGTTDDASALLAPQHLSVNCIRLKWKREVEPKNPHHRR